MRRPLSSSSRKQASASVGSAFKMRLRCRSHPKELRNKETKNFIYRSEDVQSEQYVASKINKSKQSKIGRPASHLCTAEHNAATLQDKIVPLEGKPYFTCIMGVTNVQKPFLLTFPRCFLEFPPSSSSLVKLCCREKEWDVRCQVYERTKILRQGWKQFAADNNLRIGDGCVFELLDSKDLKFRVQILNGEVPAIASSTATDGKSIDNPIFIN